MQTAPLDPTLIDAFGEQGFVIVPDLLDSEDLESFAPHVDAGGARRNAGDTREFSKKSRYEQCFQQCINLWEDCPEVRPLTFHPRLARAAAELLVVAVQRPQTFVSKVDFVTTPGERVRHVVSTLGRFERREGVLVLVAAFESAGRDREDALERIRAGCGFELRVADELAWLARASREELATLRIFDPERAFLGRPGAAS